MPCPPNILFLDDWSNTMAGANSGVEQIYRQWVVDFDQISGTQMEILLATVVICSAPGGGTINVRLGGTFGAVSGTVLLTVSGSLTDWPASGGEAPVTASAVVARPTGAQILTISAIGNGFCSLQPTTLILRAS